MRIYIEYDSCWQNSILDDKTISPRSNTRKFNKSKASGNAQSISNCTVMGILYRLIGEQRALATIKKSDNQYFSDIEEDISFSLKNHFDYNELVMLINKSNDRCADGKYIGIPKDDSSLFFSEHSQQLWSVLYLKPQEIMNFINTPTLIMAKGSSMPRDILNRISEIQDIEPLETIEKLVSKERFKQDKQKERLLALSDANKITKLTESIDKIDEKITEIQIDERLMAITNSVENTLLFLKEHFSDIPREDYIKKGGEIQLIRIYSAALYLQAELMVKSGLDICSMYILQSKGPNKGRKTIQGFSKKGFNGVRDFLNPLSTGGNKKTVKTPFLLTKASGQLEINLDISRDRAKEIKLMIENAGVSSFYLGKKGLAYVSSISTRELQK